MNKNVIYFDTTFQGRKIIIIIPSNRWRFGYMMEVEHYIRMETVNGRAACCDIMHCIVTVGNLSQFANDCGFHCICYPETV